MWYSMLSSRTTQHWIKAFRWMSPSHKCSSTSEMGNNNCYVHCPYLLISAFVLIHTSPSFVSLQLQQQHWILHCAPWWRWDVLLLHLLPGQRWALCQVCHHGEWREEVHGLWGWYCCSCTWYLSSGALLNQGMWFGCFFEFQHHVRLKLFSEHSNDAQIQPNKYYGIWFETSFFLQFLASLVLFLSEGDNVRVECDEASHPGALHGDGTFGEFIGLKFWSKPTSDSGRGSLFSWSWFCVSIVPCISKQWA